MSYVKFYLDHPSNGAYGVRMRIRYAAGQYLRYPTGERLEKKYWSVSKNRVLSSHNEYRSINAYLDHIQYHFNNVVRELQVNNTLTKTTLKNECIKYFRKDAVGLYSYFDAYIKEKANPRLYSEDTQRKYQNVRDKLYSFNPSLSFSDITLNTMVLFTNYLFSEYNLSTNTVNRYIKFFKSFLINCIDRDLVKEINRGAMSYSVPTKETRHPYLSLDELWLIEKKIYKEKHLSNAKIELLKGCYSGLRHSDWHKLNLDNLVNIDGRAYFQIMAEKTKDFVFIPFSENLKRVMAKKSYPMTNQRINLYLKDICKGAGIDSNFIKPSYKGNKIETKTYKKYEIVSSHIARRSFVCNSIKAGIPTQIIMKITGHKTESSFNKYVQLSTVDGLEVLFN